MIEYADVVCDVSWGDTGKGKIVSYLSRENDYDFVARWAGGNNAGHTVYLNGERFKTHLIPSGVFHGVKSIIGPACVLELNSFFEEVNYLSKAGFDTSLIKVSPRTNIVIQDHIDEDKRRYHKSLGTTAKGIAPCYSAKMARVGVLAKEISSLESFIWNEDLYGKVLCEGAQGFYLDVDWGNYPYVTSSTTLPYGACSLGFSPKSIRNIWGTAKIYDTRSGIDPLFPDSLFDDNDLIRLGDLGEEYGVTTGRRRHVNWLRVDYMINAINKSGVTHIVINKCDIIKKLNIYRVINNDSIINFLNIEDMISFIRNEIISKTRVDEIYFSYSKENL